MEIAKLVLEYLKIIFAPQLIVGAITVFCVVVFREDIKALIRRIAKIKLPGGGEFVTQEDKLKEESSKQNVPPPSIDTNADKIEITKMDAQKIMEIVDGEKANARLWEYKYLNHFLILGTQRVFDWLISSQRRPTINVYDNFWMPIIPGAKEELFSKVVD